MCKRTLQSLHCKLTIRKHKFFVSETLLPVREKNALFHVFTDENSSCFGEIFEHIGKNIWKSSEKPLLMFWGAIQSHEEKLLVICLNKQNSCFMFSSLKENWKYS